MTLNNRPSYWHDPEHWYGLLRRTGALWVHDGESRRPYARMTTGLISNEYIDFTYVVRYPKLMAQFMHHLSDKLRPLLHSGTVFVGQAQGSITLASELARIFEGQFAYTVKWRKQRVLATRFRPLLLKNAFLVPVEDVHHTGSTIESCRENLVRLGFTNLAPFDVAAVNRTGGPKVSRRRIISTVEKPTLSWPEGENPFTDGPELVPPVRPKGAGSYKLKKRFPG